MESSTEPSDVNDDRKTNVIFVMADATEKNAAKEKARRLGMSVSSYVRRLVRDDNNLGDFGTTATG